MITRLLRKGHRQRPRLSLHRAGLALLLLPLTGCVELLVDPFWMDGSGAWPPPVSPGLIASPDEARPIADTEDLAWSLLQQGCIDEAAVAFTAAIDEQPMSGRPKVGYAITLAALGDLRCGADAMRLACWTDPDALIAPLDVRLQPLVDEVLLRYHHVLQRHLRDQDAALMLAALFHLRPDPAAALHAISICERIGDHSPAAVNLRILIDNSMARSEPDTGYVSRHSPMARPVPPSSDEGRDRPLRVRTDPPVADPVPPLEPTPAVVTPPPPPAPPREPIDYDKLRQSILDMSDTLDRFASKLLIRIAED